MVHPNGAAARQLWVSIAALVLTVLGGFVAAMLWFGALSADVRGNARDIDALKRGQAEATSDISRLQIAQARTDAALIEVETQFHAYDQLSDVRIAEDLRWRCMFAEKLYAMTCPPYSYFPQIARPNPTTP